MRDLAIAMLGAVCGGAFVCIIAFVLKWRECREDDPFMRPFGDVVDTPSVDPSWGDR